MTIIGVDPGCAGGLAFLFHDGRADAIRMPATERDTCDVLVEANGHDVCWAYIEAVHAMPKQGVTSMFTFGRNYGFLRGCLISNGIGFEEVTPRTWQATFSLPSLAACGGSITKKKNAHKARAQELFPGLKITHATADALLIAEYGRRKSLGKE